MVPHKILVVLILCATLNNGYSFPCTDDVDVDTDRDIRQEVRYLFLSQVGVKEKETNSGEMITKYLDAVGLGPGYAWCAAFIGYVYQEADIPYSGGTAWSPSWFPDKKVIYKRNTGVGKDSLIAVASPGDVFGIYFRSKQRIAHVGFVDVNAPGSNYVITVEGNTNDTGSREGDGVYRKYRLKSQIYKIAKWVPP